MSNSTIATLTHIQPADLATHLRSDTRSKTSIIDVRDVDYIGGHIKGCQNVPTQTHDHAMPELVRQLKDQEMVVFHCVLSQQRGPRSALRYMRERERLGVDGSQKVVVLEGGFQRWQEMYGEDKDLTEGYQKDLWESGDFHH
ncbi:hypothetical protein CAC42_3882 [Sphaceloma murrayae]|uniref:Rhodanese domain-containing protein n=1 Tax=Sphaceloma murrayae TaxID=2082308 RepID=A0A2K1QSS3_9PEZI|nr:hypothetical protein CAC42_3882 [Sphaceloma murrayae]